MKLLTYLIPMISFSLVSCSTTDLYYQPLTERPSIPWKKSSARWGGYSETSVNEVHTIRYEAYNKPTAEAASYFARLRAAERSLIDGKNHFYITTPLQLNSKAEQSYFPAYTIPGYWETERYQHCDTCPRSGKNINCHYDHVRVWSPPQYVPEHYVTNHIHTASLTIAYRGSSSQRRDARKIAHEALADSAGFGKPKLDPRAQQTLTTSSTNTSQ